MYSSLPLTHRIHVCVCACRLCACSGTFAKTHLLVQVTCSFVPLTHPCHLLARQYYSATPLTSTSCVLRHVSWEGIHSLCIILADLECSDTPEERVTRLCVAWHISVIWFELPRLRSTFQFLFLRLHSDFLCGFLSKSGLTSCLIPPVILFILLAAIRETHLLVDVWG